jgi:cellulose synthase/poly-beta-1,6-N-acetylglucosamine synthase-like glycosyltransferase
MEWLAAQEMDQANSLFGAGGIALQRCLVDQMGGLPEEVRVGVDWDLNSRLAAEKVGRAFCKRAIVRTELPATITEYWQNELRWRRAHLSALLRQPGFYLSNPKSILNNLYIYILAWGAAFASLASVLLMLVDGGRLAFQILVLWAILAGWVLLRRASLAAQVAAYTRDISWLRLVWVPPLLLVITLAAILPASLTLGKHTAHFKGPRSQQLHPKLDG